MATETIHGWCPVHRIAYLREFDPSCPQCAVQKMSPPAQLEFDKDLQKPIEAAIAPKVR